MKSIGKKMEHKVRAADIRYVSLEMCREMLPQVEERVKQDDINSVLGVIIADEVKADSMASFCICASDYIIDRDSIAGIVNESEEIDKSGYLIGMFWADGFAGRIPREHQYNRKAPIAVTTVFADNSTVIYTGDYEIREDGSKNLIVKEAWSTDPVTHVDLLPLERRGNMSIREDVEPNDLADLLQDPEKEMKQAMVRLVD